MISQDSLPHQPLVGGWCSILSIGLQPLALAQLSIFHSQIPHSVVDSRVSLMPTGQSAGRRRYMSWHSKLSRFQDRPNHSIAPIIDDVGTRQHMPSFFALCVPFGRSTREILRLGARGAFPQRKHACISPAVALEVENGWEDCVKGKAKRPAQGSFSGDSGARFAARNSPRSLLPE